MLLAVEEIIKARYPFYDPCVYGKDVELCGEQVSKLINEARIEAIKECAEKAKTGQGEQWRKDAILKLIDQVK